MKRFIILSAMTQICCLSAMAYPTTGDRIVQIQKVTTPDGHIVESEITQELRAVRPGTFLYVKTEKNLPSGSIVRREQQIHDWETVSESQVSAVLNKCELLGGSREQLQVGSTRIATCRVSVPGSRRSTTAWYGHVPFGFVKMTKDYDDKLGGAVETVTHSFQLGK